MSIPSLNPLGAAKAADVNDRLKLIAKALKDQSKSLWSKISGNDKPQNYPGRNKLWIRPTDPVADGEIVTNGDLWADTHDPAQAKEKRRINGQWLLIGLVGSKLEKGMYDANGNLLEGVFVLDGGLNGVVDAIVTAETNTLRDADSALSQRVDTVTASVGTLENGLANKATVTQLSEVSAGINNKLSATWQVTLNANSKISGVKAYNDGATSTFDIVADAFRVSKPGNNGLGELVFTVGSVGGQNKVGIRGDLLVDGSIASASLAAGSVVADKIAAGAINASKLSVASLAAITASTGELYVSGNLHMTGGAILGGARWGWDWRAGSGDWSQNMYIGPNGILLGSYNAGKYMQYSTSDGSLNIVGGTLTATNITAGSVKGGAFTGYAWPAAGQQGYYLGPEGLLLGNMTTGTHLQYSSTAGALVIRGDVQATSLSGQIVTGDHIIAGTLTAEKIVARGISQIYTGTTSAWYTVNYPDSIVLTYAKYSGQGVTTSPLVGWATSGVGTFNFVPPSSGSPNVNVIACAVIVLSR